MFERLSVAQKLSAVLGTFFIAVVVGTLVTTLAIASLSQSGRYIAENDYPLSQATSDIKLSATEAHLKMEEIMGGDGAESVDEVYGFLNDARTAAEAILSGGTIDGMTVVAAQSEAIRDMISSLLTKLDSFNDAVQSRYALLADEQGVGSSADEEFDSLFDEITDDLAALAGKHPSNPTMQTTVGEARFLVTLGHLLVEEVLGGDATEDFAEAVAQFDAATAALTTINAIEPAPIETILSKIARFSELALTRFNTERDLNARKEAAEVGFDATFSDFISTAANADQLVRDDIKAALVSMQQSRLIAFAASAAICAILATVVFTGYRMLNRMIGARLKELANVMRQLLGGDLTIETPQWPAQDEVGVLRDSVDQLRNALLRQRELERATELERQNSEAQRQAAETQKQVAERALADAERERTAAAKRVSAAEQFADEFSQVVDRVVEGQFSRRIQMQFDEPDYAELARGLNSILTTVESSLVDTTKALRGVVDGDLSLRMTGQYKGVFADLQRDVNATMAELETLVARILETAEAIETESSSMSSNANLLSGKSENQAATVEETSAAMTEMAANVKSNADNAVSAKATAADAADKAAEGGEIVTTAVSAMERIETSSREISKIVEVIDSIAFQTNLLALNAGVEAARAGDAGKGFAVVASEVRALALRASDAARDINALIDKSNHEVGEGSRLVRSSGTALTQIVSNVAKVVASIDEISMASSEQATGISEVSEAVARIDKTTQETALLAGQSATAAEDLAQRAGQLRSLVSRFEISSETQRDNDWRSMEEASAAPRVHATG